MMDAVEVGPQSSVEEIEENRIFIDTLLQSLDDGADDYAQRCSELKAQFRYCDGLLASKQELSTPSSSRHYDAPNSATLPSRSRPAIPDWGRRDTSPSHGRPQAGSSHKLDLGIPLSFDGYGSESSNGGRKRQRVRSSLHPNDGSAKVPRTASNTRPTTSSTSESADSVEDFDLMPSDSRVYEMYKKRAQLQEARWKQEQRDKELARQMSQDLAGPSTSAAASNTNQAYLQSNGSFGRAQPSPPVQSQQNHVPLGYHQSTGPHIKSEPPTMNNLHTGHHAQNYIDTEDDDDDISMISPQQFHSAGRPSQPQHATQARPFPSSRFGQPDMPGAFPQGAWTGTTTSYSQPSYMNPRGLQSTSHGPSQSSYGQDMTTMQRLQNFVGGLPGSAFNALPSSGSSAYPSYHPPPNIHHGQAGSAVFGGMVDSDDDEPGPGGFTSRQLEDLRSRNMEYMLSDPGKTKDEIAQLLENIRPDEELPPEMREGGPAGLSVPLMEHQKLGLTWLKNQEESTNRGAILADDMGLGKTIQALALILARPSNDQAVKTTVIVAPVALLRQWQKEIETKVVAKHRLKVHIYHGPGAKIKYARLAAFDVVLTTYGTLGAELKRILKWESDRFEQPPTNVPKPELNFLGDHCRWWRVILDEAQAIKGRNTNAAQAACRLQAEHRLAMTGTPMMNNIDELYSLIKFLRIAPYHELSKFTQTFSALKKSSTEKQKKRSMKCLQALLKALLLRRTKQSKIDGNPILNLKGRMVGEDNAVFDEEQKAFYDHIAHKSQLQFNKYLKAGTIGKNYSNILVMLLRLRQACDHPHLISDHGIPVDAEASEEQMVDYASKLNDGAIQRIIEANGAFECPICYDATENPTIFFPCGHDVCSECFTQMMDPSLAVQRGEDATTAKCPECRQVVDPHKLLTYNLFQKVHLPEAYKEKFGEDALATPDSDGDSDSDFDSDYEDVDPSGNLDGFVVNDDDDIEEGSETEDDTQEPWTKVKREEDSEFKKPSKSKKAGKRKSNSASKGKGKGKAMRKKALAELKKDSLRNVAAKKKYLKRLRKNFVSSAKIDKTIEILQGVRDNDSTEKTIIFSQFTSFLDLIEVPMSDQHWSYMRYDGSMNAKARNEAVDKFVDDPNCNIMLISLKAGNAGLNLNCASQVIILDPFWNPFIEEQAIDRAHRIGQMRDVHVHRVLIQDTVEDRIVALQEKKRELINQALDEKAGQKLSRLGREELIFLFGSGEHGPDVGPESSDHEEELSDLMSRAASRTGRAR